MATQILDDDTHSSQQAFTPGPWDSEWWWWIIRDMHNQPAFDRGEKEGCGYPGFDGNTDANAALIAAAPDLYAAALLAAPHGDSLQHGPNVSISAAAYRALCTALAKARGEG